MKKIFILLFIFLSINIKAQDLPDNFKIGDFFEIYANDSIKFYFRCPGNIQNELLASYYRIGKIDSINNNITGEFIDFYTNGKKALVGNMYNNCLNGQAIYYYENGQIRKKGSYKHGAKTGVWRYFYKNGQLEKVLNFVKGIPFIAEYNKKNGKQLVVNGNGMYKGEFKTYKSCSPFLIQGMVKNGKKDGKWSWYINSFGNKIGVEHFEENRFIFGESKGYTYSDKQQIQIYSNDVSENIKLHHYFEHWILPKDRRQYFIKYNGKSIRNEFLTSLLSSINETINWELSDQWIIIGLSISNKNEIAELNIKSSINDNAVEKSIYNLIKMKDGWSTYPEKIKVDFNFNLFFTILIKNNEFIIPSIVAL